MTNENDNEVNCTNIIDNVEIDKVNSNTTNNISEDKLLKEEKNNHENISPNIEENVQLGENDHEKNSDLQSSQESEDEVSNKKKKILSFNSKSEDEISNPNSPVNNIIEHAEERNEINAVKKKKILKIDSDSEEETENKSKINLESLPQEKKTNIYNYDPDIYDAEGSDEETINHDNENQFENFNDSEDNKDAGIEDEKIDLKRNKTVKQRKPERKSAKIAKEEMKVIQSESARMVRESRISLPYHKPKQRTLTEFLQRKKTPLQVKSVKVFGEELEIVSKNLEERQKEVAEFYKSDDEETEEIEERENNVSKQIDSQIDVDLNEEKQKSLTENNDIISDVSETTNNLDSTQENEINITLQTSKNNEQSLNVKINSAEDNILKENNKMINEMNDKNSNINLETEKEKNISVENNISEVNKENKPIFQNLLENTKKINLDQEETIFTLINGDQGESQSLIISEKSMDNVSLKNSNDDSLESNQSLTNLIQTSKDNEPKPQRYSRFLDIKSSNITPRLSSGPNDIIEFEFSSGQNQRDIGVLNLMQKFIKHTKVTPKTKSKAKVEVSVMSAEKNEDNSIVDIKHETIKVNIGENDISNLFNNDDIIPGGKHTLLKEDLRKRIARQRNAEWAEREAHKKIYDNELELDEKGEDGNNEDNFLDDENEEEFSDRETSEEELEEDDIDIKDKKRKQSAFVDEEAEESDDEEEVDNDNESELEQDENDNEGDEMEDEFDKNEEEIESQKEQTTPKRNGYRRVISVDMFNSDDESNERDNEGNLMASIPIQPNQSTNSQIGLTQPVADQTPFARPFPPGLSVISPVCNFSPFAKRNQSLETSPKVEDYTLSYPETSPIGIPEFGVGRHSSNDRITSSQTSNFAHVPKQLFQDNSQSQESNDLIGLCSGKFPSDDSKSAQVDDDLIGLCSGQGFFTQSQSSENPSEKQSSHRNEPIIEKEPIVNETFTFRILDSDEEEELEKMEKQKKKVKKINFSDDDASDNEDKLVNSDNEEEDNDTNDNEEKDNDTNDNEENDNKSENIDELDYDSEENEIPKINKPQDFFDQEAELSESEWGSADEDEKDLDHFEMEDGDAEHHDQDKLKEQLGKIHMRRVLDDDQREVRLIQELLLEDGELHSEGPGRERKFHWKDIDLKFDLNGTKTGEEGEQMLDSDEEHDAEWRKMRLDREAFLEKNPEIADEEEENSKFLKMGKAALSRLRSSNSNSSTPSNSKSKNIPNTFKDLLTSPDPKNPFKITKKRGSFLSRGEAALEKLASLTGLGTNNGQKLANSTGRNFVFATVHPVDDEQKESEVVTPTTQANGDKRKKRKQIQQETPPLVKRLRVNEEKIKRKSLFANLTPT